MQVELSRASITSAFVSAEPFSCSRRRRTATSDGTGVMISSSSSLMSPPLRPNYYWTAEMRCCAEYLRSLALCELGNPSRVTGLHDGKRSRPCGCLRCYPARRQAYEIHPKSIRVTALPPLWLLNRLRDRLRIRHYSLRSEQAYPSRIPRFILTSSKRHPAQMG